VPDEAGGPSYFYDTATGESRWDRPEEMDAPQVTVTSRRKQTPLHRWGGGAGTAAAAAAAAAVSSPPPLIHPPAPCLPSPPSRARAAFVGSLESVDALLQGKESPPARPPARPRPPVLGAALTLDPAYTDPAWTDPSPTARCPPARLRCPPVRLRCPPPLSTLCEQPADGKGEGKGDSKGDSKGEWVAPRWRAKDQAGRAAFHTACAAGHAQVRGTLTALQHPTTHYDTRRPRAGERHSHCTATPYNTL
jgi:hypothetical protein